MVLKRTIPPVIKPWKAACAQQVWDVFYPNPSTAVLCQVLLVSGGAGPGDSTGVPSSLNYSVILLETWD